MHRCLAHIHYRNRYIHLRGRKTMPSFTCKDIGMECSHVSSGTTNQELMRNFIAHAGSTHKIHVLPAEVIYRVQKAIKK